MTFARRIAIGAIAASLVPLLFAALFFSNLKEGTRKRQQVLMAQKALVLTGLLERLVIDMETGVRGFRIKGAEAFLEPYNAASVEYGPVLSELDAVLAAGEEDRKILGKIREGVERWRNDLAEPRIAAIRAAPPVVTKRGILLSTLPESLDLEAGKERTDSLRALFDELRSRQEKRIEKLNEERTRTDTDLSRELWIGAVGFSMLVFAGALQLRRRADELVEARERLASILESIGEGVVVADRNGKFTVFNPAAELLLGLGATATGPDEWTETYGVFLPDGVTPFPAEELPLARAIRGESVNDVEIHIRNSRVPAGASLSVSGRPIRAAEGSIRGGVVVLRDVTERKRADEAVKESERVLTQQTAQLESANRELEAFAYSVAHDLRAPLRAIDGFSQVLLEDYGERLGESGRDALGRVRAGAGRMSDLIDDMLKLSRVTRADLQRTQVDLSETARGVMAELSQREPDRRVDTRIEEGVVVEGDRALLRLVVENLLGNAFKFTSKTSGARVEFGVERQNGEPVYFVRDNGAGYEPAYADKLFGAFQRLHSAAEFPGTGIGLATVQRIVHRHGGRVWAEGAVDGGATFRFTL